MNIKLLFTFGLFLLLLIITIIKIIYYLNLKKVGDVGDNDYDYDQFVCQTSGSFAHPTRCDAFYLCVGFIPIKLYCPIDYEYDEIEKTCLPKSISNNKCTANN
ncbi:ac150 [Oxyplax ochracea nucleopolyhedrovirus]|uniref:Ac150 n=1 Tax=Oxyplax ochracea nucleopolyhedrovirus TaxID=2083176 RepID=A0A2L0WTX3_9ABAC|nr:ac150 [Oxyplax ochracea nucleopolyhedrovirus]AVA31103.1 ac150 [Oxyplax ochracea nucleopolyhedrovirus]